MNGEIPMMSTEAEIFRFMANERNLQNQHEDAVLNTRIINVAEEMIADCMPRAARGLYSHHVSFSDYEFLFSNIHAYDEAIMEQLTYRGFTVHQTHPSHLLISWEEKVGAGS